jgi:hypothetical protein
MIFGSNKTSFTHTAIDIRGWQVSDASIGHHHHQDVPEEEEEGK